jgi:phosphoribosylaminoimidazole carboxylase (NCAIR synthetase)
MDETYGKLGILGGGQLRRMLCLAMHHVSAPHIPVDQIAVFHQSIDGTLQSCLLVYILAAQHVRQLVFTHRLGQRQASVVLAARVVEVRMVKNA